MRKLVSLFSLTLVVSLAAACGGDDGDDNGNNLPDAAPTADAAPTVDAAPVRNGANLGTICDGATMCPADHTCIVGIATIASPTMSGYCSPNCGNGTAMGDSTICSNMYPGPATGQVQCALVPQGASNPESCAIICPNGNADCPNALTCHTIDNGGTPIGVCGGNDWAAP